MLCKLYVGSVRLKFGLYSLVLDTIIFLELNKKCFVSGIYLEKKNLNSVSCEFTKLVYFQFHYVNRLVSI